MDAVLEAEHVALCGVRCAHVVERQALRAGHVARNNCAVIKQSGELYA